MLNDEKLNNNIHPIVSQLQQHNTAIVRSNIKLHTILEGRETTLQNLTEGGYSISKNLNELKKGTHNLHASIQIISEATEVALSSLAEQKEDWKKRSLNLETATSEFNKIIKTVAQSISNLRELGEKIKRIENDMNQMNNISHLTSGVSRNAGIKAYHAGEKGKGFEVIAKELSQLTKQSLGITEKVPESIKRFQTKTKEALNFITELTHNVEQVERSAQQMKLKIQSSEKMFADFIAVSNIIHNTIEKQIRIKEKLGKEEENIATYSKLSLIETGNITTIEQSYLSLSLLINKFVDNSSQMVNALTEMGKDDSLENIKKITLNTDKLKEYIQRISLLTSQIKETSKEAKKLLESQSGKVSEIADIMQENKQVKKKIVEKTNSLMNILNNVSQIFIETNSLSEKIVTIIKTMMQLTERADAYFTSLEAEIEWVDEILKKLKVFSKKSNLLSLYASIETARAFEFKKSFDVIVNQIKELSQQSAGLLKTIERSVAATKLSLKNVHSIMSKISHELGLTENQFSSVLKDFDTLNLSTEKLSELVKEMLNSLDKQTLIEQELASFEEISSSKIKENILKNRELTEQTKKTGFVMSKILEEIEKCKEELSQFSLAIQELPKKVLRLRLSGDIIYLDPSKTTDSTSNRVISNIFKGLVEHGTDANVIPSIAKRWKLSEDALVWEFTLRNNVRFHNGELLKASDVQFTIEHLLTSPHSYMFDMIKGAKDYIQKKTKTVEGLEITGEYNITITLDYPHIPFLKNLGVSSAGIIKQSGDELIGAGPFKLKKWEKGKEIILEAFDDYFGKKPFCDELHFIICHDEKEAYQRFLNGELDILEIPSSISKETISEKEKTNEINIRSYPIYDIYYVGINVRQETPFKQKMARQVLNYAINRKEYIEKTSNGRGIPAKGIFPPNFSTYNRSLTGYNYNPEKARDLLKKMGFPNGLTGEYRLDIRDSKIAICAGEILKKYLSEVGIQLKLKTHSWSELLKQVHSGQSLFFSLGWSNDNGDPDSFLYPLFHSKNWGEPGNTSFYKNETVDRILDEAAALTDHYMRQKLYQQVEEILVDDAPWIFLYHSQHNIATQLYIRGYSKNPLTSEKLEDVWFY